MSSSDAAGNTASSGDLTFTTNAPSIVVSDDFPRRIGVRPGVDVCESVGRRHLNVDGSQAVIEVPGGVDHLVNAGAAWEPDTTVDAGGQ